MIRAGLFVLMLILMDQAVKYAIISMMEPGQYHEITSFFALYHVQNSGIAFSMLASFSDWGLIGLTVIVIGFVISLWWKAKTDCFLSHCGYLLVLGGAFGNLIDRLRFHYVTDYIFVFYRDWSFAVFNLADCFITIGALLIILREIFVRKTILIYRFLI